MSAVETTAEDLIARWPSDRDFTDDLGVRPQEAVIWRYRGYIPTDQWPSLLEAAGARGIGVTLAELGAMMLNAVRRPRTSVRPVDTHFGKILGLWPETGAAAADLGVTPKYVRVMRARRWVPPQFWARLLDGAARRDLPVSKADLVDATLQVFPLLGGGPR